MLRDAIEIMKYIVCPSCRTKSIDQYLIEQLRHKHTVSTKELIDNQNGTVSTYPRNENLNVHLYLTCGNCKFTIKIINKEWLKIFYQHAFGM